MLNRVQEVEEFIFTKLLVETISFFSEVRY